MKSRLRNKVHLVAYGLRSILTVLALALVADSLLGACPGNLASKSTAFD
jgi:hypothetical protein